MRVAEIAELTGTTVRTVRYYHSLGLLPVPAERGGWRDYELGHVARLSRIRWLVQAGVSLETIKRVLDEPEATSVEQIDDARKYVREALDSCPVDVAAARTVIGVAGTVTSLSAIGQNLTDYDRAKVHRSVLTVGQISDLAGKLLSSTVDEVEQIGPLKRRRAEVLCGGAVIIDEVCRRATAGKLVVSETDILDGMALAMLAQGS